MAKPSCKPICAWWAHDCKNSSTTDIFGTMHFFFCHLILLPVSPNGKCKFLLTTSSPTRVGLFVVQVCVPFNEKHVILNTCRVAQINETVLVIGTVEHETGGKTTPWLSLLGCPNWHKTGRCSRAPIRHWGLWGRRGTDVIYTVKEKRSWKC